jgi:probable HAF family extracellular repeat protein
MASQLISAISADTQNAALAINDRGQIVGASYISGYTYHHAFFWQNGHMTDLGTLPGDVASAAVAINNQGQVTGVSIDPSGQNLTAFLWQKGAMYDLNNLVYGNTPLYLLHGFGINTAGEIVGLAFNTNAGEVHGFLASPVHFSASSQNASPAAVPATGESQKLVLPEDVRRQLQQQLPVRRLVDQPPDPCLNSKLAGCKAS